METIAAADNAQTVPALAYDADRGRFLAAWTDYRNSATDADVYGRERLTLATSTQGKRSQNGI